MTFPCRACGQNTDLYGEICFDCGARELDQRQTTARQVPVIAPTQRVDPSPPALSSTEHASERHDRRSPQADELRRLQLIADSVEKMSRSRAQILEDAYSMPSAAYAAGSAVFPEHAATVRRFLAAMGGKRGEICKNVRWQGDGTSDISGRSIGTASTLWHSRGWVIGRTAERSEGPAEDVIGPGTRVFLFIDGMFRVGHRAQAGRVEVPGKGLLGSLRKPRLLHTSYQGWLPLPAGSTVRVGADEPDPNASDLGEYVWVEVPLPTRLFRHMEAAGVRA